MPDQKPPRVDGGERETLQALLQYQRESLVRKVDGLDDASARRRMVGSDTTLLWLVRHAARAEITWVLSRFAGEDVIVPEDSIAADDTLVAALGAYRATWGRTDAVIVAAATFDERCRGLAEDEESVNLRWVLMHLLEETARHAGHADILRELIDGQTGR
ncbi:MAG TPA: DinB family protein [Acidimicrobiales bacterium]|nr:DinB family protein [Acidimicrobiales bacterium]